MRDSCAPDGVAGPCPAFRISPFFVIPKRCTARLLRPERNIGARDLRQSDQDCRPERAQRVEGLLPFCLRCHPEATPSEGSAFVFRLVGQPSNLLFTILNHNQHQQQKPTQPAANAPVPIPPFRLHGWVTVPACWERSRAVSSVAGRITCGNYGCQSLRHPPSSHSTSAQFYRSRQYRVRRAE